MRFLGGNLRRFKFQKFSEISGYFQKFQKIPEISENSGQFLIFFDGINVYEIRNFRTLTLTKTEVQGSIFIFTKCGGPSTCDNQRTSPQLNGKAKYWDLLRYSTTSSNTASPHSLSGVDANSWWSGVESSTSGRVAEPCWQSWETGLIIKMKRETY